MSNILENMNRLSDALDELDGVMATRAKGESLRDIANQRDSLQKELVDMKQENADLRKALKLAQRRHDNLVQASELVSARLDGAIGEIKTVLES